MYDSIPSEYKIDVSKGMLIGSGINLRKPNAEIEDVFLPWKSLNSHFMCFGTTRQGKTRLMAFMMRQIIEKGDHLVVIEPKGSEGQEVMSWVAQYAVEHNSEKSILYWSPEYVDKSIKINLLYGQNDEEATATVSSSMKVEDEFYADIAEEILMCVLPSLSFIEELEDKLVIEMFEKMEYAKALIESPINEINKKILNDFYDEDWDSIHVDIIGNFLDGENGNGYSKEELERAYKKAKAYQDGKGEIPLRSFVTFEDLAQYTSQEKISTLYDYLENTLAEAKSNGTNPEIIRRGEKASRNLEKLKNRDAGYFSKVSTSYAVTMSKLSTGNVGKLLCGSRVNILKDRFFESGSRVILIAQPFPMVYGKTANMITMMLMSMLNSTVASVGTTGVSLERRIHVCSDESGSVANGQLLSLANKGGGLAISLYLYSQSFADYKDVLGEDGATILADNSNTKTFFLVNDDKSAETISAIIGGKKRGDVTYGHNEGATSRGQGRAVDEQLIPPHLIMQLQPMTFVMKTGSEVYMMQAPFQKDPFLEIFMGGKNHKKRADKFSRYIQQQREQDINIGKNYD